MTEQIACQISEEFNHDVMYCPWETVGNVRYVILPEDIGCRTAQEVRRRLRAIKRESTESVRKASGKRKRKRLKAPARVVQCGASEICERLRSLQDEAKRLQAPVLDYAGGPDWEAFYPDGTSCLGDRARCMTHARLRGFSREQVYWTERAVSARQQRL